MRVGHRRTLQWTVGSLALAGLLLASGLPAQAYPAIPATVQAACSPATQTGVVGSPLRNVVCTYSYTNAEGGPVVGQAFQASATGARLVGTPSARTNAKGQATASFAYLTACAPEGGTQTAVLTGTVAQVPAQTTAMGTCPVGVAPTTAAQGCQFSQNITGTGTNGREDICTFHANAPSSDSVSYQVTQVAGAGSAVVVHGDSAPDANGNFSVTVNFYNGDSYSVTAALRTANGDLGPSATQPGSSTGADYAANAQAINPRSLFSYSVMSATAITDDGTSTFCGNIGVNTAAAMTTVTEANVSCEGKKLIANDRTHQANFDGTRAYDAIGRLPRTATFGGDLNGKTFTPGVYYTAAAFTVTGTFTLDAQGDPNAVFIFIIDAALNTEANSRLKLVNGAQAANVTYRSSGAANTGANSEFFGTILSAGAVTIGNGTRFHGNLYSQAAITLCNNKMFAP